MEHIWSLRDTIQCLLFSVHIFHSVHVLHSKIPRGFNLSCDITYYLPQSSADGCGEETVDDGVGGRVEGRQALDEGGHGDVGLGARHVAVHLE